MLRLTLATLLALLPACKSSGTHHADEVAATDAGPGGAKVAADLPAPYELEEQPLAVAYVRDPAGVLDVAGALIPGVPPASGVIELLLGTQMPAELAHRVAPLIAPRLPWVAAQVGGEDVVHLPIAADKVEAAAAIFAELPAVGEFGAVQLPEPALSLQSLAGGGDEAGDGGGEPPKARLAWVRRDRSALTLALSERGLVTGGELSRAYSSKALRISAEAERIRPLVPDFPYAGVTVEGAGLDDLTITVRADPEKGLPVAADLAPGALTNLHAHPSFALAASGRWAKAEPTVKQIIREINRQVDNAGFAAKMLLDPLAQQAIGVLKSWNGRVFVGLGPAGHLAFGLGADDPVKAGQGLIKFLGAASDNLELARMFVSDVPKIGVRRHAKDPEIQVVTVQGARKMMPAEVAAFLDERGNLKVAIGYVGKGGAVFGVVGPRAEDELAAWVKSIDAAPAADESLGDLVAVTVALAPAQLQELLGVADPKDPKALIKAGAALSPGRAPTQIVVRQEKDRYVITSKGPAGTLEPVRQGRGG